MADIVYDYLGGLYLNLTNECPCRCVFCIRDKMDTLGSASEMWHEEAPDFDAIRIGFEFGVGLSASASAKLHSAYLMHKICNTILIYAENIWKSEKIFKNNLFFRILLLPL